jgi:small subunit ribosomal protein S25
LKTLVAPPKLELSGVKALKLTLAQRNDHWGARYFAKEQLPKLKWANQQLEVEIQKIPKTATDIWRPELEVRFDNGRVHIMNLQNMWSTAILRSLMDIAGTSGWTAWKAHTREHGVPTIPGEEKEPQTHGVIKDLPSFSEFRASSQTTSSTESN